MEIELQLLFVYVFSDKYPLYSRRALSEVSLRLLSLVAWSASETGKDNVFNELIYFSDDHTDSLHCKSWQATRPDLFITIAAYKNNLQEQRIFVSYDFEEFTELSACLNYYRRMENEYRP